MSEHCPGCCGDSRPHIVQVSTPCPGLQCAACREKEAEIAKLNDVHRQTINTADAFRTALGHCEADLISVEKRYEETNEQNGRLVAEIARLVADLRYVQGIVERGESREVGGDEPITQAILDYVKKLEALVAVGREMATALEHGLATIRADGQENVCRVHILLATEALAKWRALEEK